ncbi:hypothetical protein G6011_02373 [Alternaria panax]|uniref:Uncharacterized protein n=1 Tax=Alternaria panax TaxID=48097 RepID=A0AAD4FFK5_9PLEO|nr:hypothetical protein G6011_02373 [Alternaria panax]
MPSFGTTYYASTTAIAVATIPAATMTTTVRSAPAHSITSPAETHTNTRAPELSKPLSSTAIGLVGGLGGCGILGFFIWAVVYFRWFKPIGMPTTEEKAGYLDASMTEQSKSKSKNRNSTIMEPTQGVLLHNASGTATARPSTDGGVYPSVGIAVNTALEREILEILEVEIATIGRCRGLGSGLV